jgi:hypothetical protein
MNQNKLIDVKIDIHKEQVVKLQEIEDKLTRCIGAIGNPELNEYFIDWLNQRNRCNDTYFAIIKVLTNGKIVL